MRFILSLLILFSASVGSAQRCESLFATTQAAPRDFQIESVLREMFSSENLVFTMAQNIGLREKILHAEANGGFVFKNMYQTKTTNAQAPIDARLENEAIRLGMTPEEVVERLKPEQLPKYGYLQFKKNPVYENASNTKLLLKSYGEDFYTFKSGNVYETSTMTIGDSFMLPRSKTTLRKALEMGTLKSPDSMNHRFVSFKHENFVTWLIENLFSREAKKLEHKYAMQGQSERDSESFLIKAFQGWLKTATIAQPYFGSDLLQLENTGLGFKKKYPYNYFEVQYHKSDLNLNDVETFTFSKTRPSSEFLQILRSYNIKIYDATNSSVEPILIE